MQSSLIRALYVIDAVIACLCYMPPKVEMLTFYFKRFRNQLNLKILKKGLNGVMGVDLNILSNVLKSLYTNMYTEKTL